MEFLSFFDTPEKLLGGDARAFLLAAAMHLRWEICRIECRHALCRKWTRAWQTVSANVIDISTRFMIQRHRELDSFFDECGVPGPNPAEKTRGTAAKHKKQKRRMCSAGVANDAVQKVGGGGPWRAFMKEKLAGRKIKKGQRRQAFVGFPDEYRAINLARGAEWKRLVELGKAGTVSYAAAGSAFGGENYYCRETGEAEAE